MKCFSKELKYFLWLSGIPGIFTSTFKPFPLGEINTENTNLSWDNLCFSWSISLLLLYPSKSKHISPLCVVRDESNLFEKTPLKHTAGSDCLSTFLFVLSFSDLISLTSSLLDPSLILSKITPTSLWKGWSVSLMSLNMVIFDILRINFVLI